MPWPTRLLTDTDKEMIVALMPALARDLRREISSWPKNACADSSLTLLPRLREHLGTHALRFRVVNGRFTGGGHVEAGHTWLETALGEIVDPTAGQFLGGSALHFFAPGDPQYQRRHR